MRPKLTNKSLDTYARMRGYESEAEFRDSYGNLDVTMDVRNNLEFDSLSNDINATVDTLKRYIKDAEERIDAELAFAKAIQHSALPSVFPPYPNRKEFEIFATMHTAKEVGGDFYDFYFVDEGNLAFLMLKRVTDHMEHTLAYPYDAQRYAQMLKMSPSHFQHIFKQQLGISPYAYCLRLRMENARSLLEATELKIQDIAQNSGYDNALYFTQAFRKETGLTPSAYRKKHGAGKE